MRPGLRAIFNRIYEATVIHASKRIQSVGSASVDIRKRRLLLTGAAGLSGSLGFKSDPANAAKALQEPSSDDTITICPNVMALRKRAGAEENAACLCLGYWHGGDGGGGVFTWHSESSAEDDGALTIRPYGSPGSWIRANTGAEVNVKWFGARGDGRSDDTAALAAALSHLMSYGMDVAQPSARFRPALYLPSGIYNVGPLPVLRKTQDVRIRGDGASATKIIFQKNSRGSRQILFDLGEFSEHPSNNWAGDAQGFALSDLYLGYEGTADNNAALFGACAIRDNGCGSLDINHVTFWGFDHAIVSPYGSDFSRFIDCNFRFNRIGVYLGPGSQQVNMSRLKFDRNGTAVIFDAVPQGDIQSCYFMDQQDCDILFEYSGSNSTRFDVHLPQKVYKGMFAIKDCWFETGTVQNGEGNLRAHIHTSVGGGPNNAGPSCITAQRIFLVSGTRNMAQEGKKYFWLNESGSNNRIEDITVWGDYIDHLINEESSNSIELHRVNNL